MGTAIWFSTSNVVTLFGANLLGMNEILDFHMNHFISKSTGQTPEQVKVPESVVRHGVKLQKPYQHWRRLQ